MASRKIIIVIRDVYSSHQGIMTIDDSDLVMRSPSEIKMFAFEKRLEKTEVYTRVLQHFNKCFRQSLGCIAIRQNMDFHPRRPADISASATRRPVSSFSKI